jgi:predicted nuclease of restriction endonuclease-like (RecB) superfamily
MNIEEQIVVKLEKLVGSIVIQAKQKASISINSVLVLRNWNIGKRINAEVFKAKSEKYGQGIVLKLAKRLTNLYGKGFDNTSISRMRRFADLYADKKKVATLSQQLTWSHIVEIIALDDSIKRNFYTEMARVGNWSVRMLRKQVNGMLFERTAISKRSDSVAKDAIEKLHGDDQLTPDLILKDPYILDFAGLDRTYTENDLENAILNELEKFIRELGNDFCFIERQKRMSTTRKDRYLDLLFFHRGLKRLVAIELKLGVFEPSHKGQMEWYLQWLDKNEKKEGEEKPLGIILCADKDQEDVEYLMLNDSGIHVAQYFTELPPKKKLEAKLHEAIKIAKAKYREILPED